MPKIVKVPCVSGTTGVKINLSDKYTENFKHLELDLELYPHVSEEGVKKYTQYVEQNLYGTASSGTIKAHEVYETVKPMWIKVFKPDESIFLHAVYICHGKRSFTVVARPNMPFNQVTLRIRERFDKELSTTSKMQEYMPQHIGTHCPGFLKLVTGNSLTHAHHYTLGKGLDTGPIKKLVRILFECGCLGDFTADSLSHKYMKRLLDGRTLKRITDGYYFGPYKSRKNQGALTYPISELMHDPVQMRYDLEERLLGNPVNEPKL